MPEPNPSTTVVPFAFEGEPVRVVTKAGEPWFVLADVCRVLEHSNPSQAASRLDDDERGIISGDTPSGTQDMLAVNESGLYSLILTSRKPAAKRFKKWVTAEVLPAIRRTGAYIPSFANISSRALAQKLRAVQQARIAFGPAAARQVWFDVGLPVVPAMREPPQQGALFDAPMRTPEQH